MLRAPSLPPSLAPGDHVAAGEKDAADTEFDFEFASASTEDSTNGSKVDIPGTGGTSQVDSPNAPSAVGLEEPPEHAVDDEAAGIDGEFGLLCSRSCRPSCWLQRR